MRREEQSSSTLNGAFSRNVGKLFSELKLVAGNLLQMVVSPFVSAQTSCYCGIMVAS